MKRYQCIKVFRRGLFEFNQGSIYPFEEKITHACVFRGYTTITGRIIWLMPSELSEHFQELLDLNVDDHEEEQYTAMLPSKKAIGTGCAIVVAALLTIVITLLSMI